MMQIDLYSVLLAKAIVGSGGGGGSDDGYTKAQTNALLETKQNKLTTGNGVEITNNVISVNIAGNTSLEDYGLDDYHGTTEEFVEDIEDLNVPIGTVIIGSVAFSDLPAGMGSAELKVTRSKNDVYDYTLFSADTSPQNWFLYPNWMGETYDGMINNLIDGQVDVNAAIDMYKQKVVRDGDTTFLAADNTDYQWTTNQGSLVVTLPTQTGNTSSELTETIDSLWLFSYTEIGGTASAYSPNGEGTVYPLFVDNDSRIKNIGIDGSPDVWWSRSPYLGADTYFCYSIGTGAFYRNNANTARGVALGFCVGGEEA